MRRPVGFALAALVSAGCGDTRQQLRSDPPVPFATGPVGGAAQGYAREARGSPGRNRDVELIAPTAADSTGDDPNRIVLPTTLHVIEPDPSPSLAHPFGAAPLPSSRADARDRAVRPN